MGRYGLETIYHILSVLWLRVPNVPVPWMYLSQRLENSNASSFDAIYIYFKLDVFKFSAEEKPYKTYRNLYKTLKT